MRRGYFIVATVLRAPYCAPFLFAPARHYYQSGGVIRQRETAATSSCDCRLLSTAVSGSVPATRRTKAAGYRDGTFNHRRRQQKRCGSRHLYRYAGCLSGAAFPPADYIALGHIHRAQCVGGTEHIRYCGSPIALSFDECGKSKCVHLVTFDQGNGKAPKVWLSP